MARSAVTAAHPLVCRRHCCNSSCAIDGTYTRAQTSHHTSVCGVGRETCVPCELVSNGLRDVEEPNFGAIGRISASKWERGTMGRHTDHSPSGEWPQSDSRWSFCVQVGFASRLCIGSSRLPTLSGLIRCTRNKRWMRLCTDFELGRTRPGSAGHLGDQTRARKRVLSIHRCALKARRSVRSDRVCERFEPVAETWSVSLLRRVTKKEVGGEPIRLRRSRGQPHHLLSLSTPYSYRPERLGEPRCPSWPIARLGRRAWLQRFRCRPRRRLARKPL